MHYYQFNIADYRKDTIHLTPIEHYAYRQLLDQYYLTEQPIPLDEDKVMRSLCVRIADDMQAVRNVLQDFFLKTENGYIHKRCEIEIEAYHAKSKSASESAKARWSKKNAPDSADVMRSHTEGNANHKPITNNHKPINKLKTSAIALPDWLPEEKWIQFKEMRKKIKKPLTDEAERLLIKDLQSIKDKGLDYIQALENSIKNSWQGIFEPKNVTAIKGKMDISGIDYSVGVTADGRF